MSFLRYLAYIIVLVILGGLSILVYFTITEYKPEEKEIIYSSQSNNPIRIPAEISLLTWNIGYCGLDNDMSFFYDGGKDVMASRENTVDNLNRIREFLLNNDSIDFLLLQEIDTDSKRSYNMNLLDSIGNRLSLNHYFAKNYGSYVPFPLSSPMGRVNSGLATLSNIPAHESTRHSFPGNYSWPKSIFLLDRCFLVNRYKISEENELVVINTHNSAYDDGSLRKKQMDYLKKFLLAEYEKGNYVIVGGDWNQSPPGFAPDSFSKKTSNSFFSTISINKDFMPSSWKWMYDERYPTNRYLNEHYDPQTTATTILDFFLISPNIETISVKTVNLNFENSDHNPVLANIKLK